MYQNHANDTEAALVGDDDDAYLEAAALEEERATQAEGLGPKGYTFDPPQAG
jgi:hypothetical protein